MSRVSSQQSLMPSILDRLIDPESGGTIARPGYTTAQMTQTVQRDLEDLLNTRLSLEKELADRLPTQFPEVDRSIVAYGLPDLVSLNAITPQQREQIGRQLEDCVQRFEPRLRDVRASMIDPGDSVNRVVRFRIDARLCLDPAPDVAFETELELTSGHYSVKSAES